MTHTPGPWIEARFNAATFAGQSKMPIMVPVEGVSNGIFLIDQRTNLRNPRSKAWCINHVQTGFAALLVGGPLSAAKRVADALTEVADWDFADPEEASALRHAVAPVRIKFEAVLLRQADVGPLRAAPVSA